MSRWTTDRQLLAPHAWRNPRSHVRDDGNERFLKGIGSGLM